MKRQRILCTLLVGFALLSCSESKIPQWENQAIIRTIDQLDLSFKKVQKIHKLPRSINKGFRETSDWTSGFYPGMLWLAFDATHDSSYISKANEITLWLKEETLNTHDHDIGFRIGCSYGRGYKYTHSKQYREAIIQAAHSLATRFNPTVQAIQSWDAQSNKPWKFPVIIDNMMNLELLCQASKLSGDSIFKHIAIVHANTTMRNHYRDNYSCVHVVDFDPMTGNRICQSWNNGDSIISTATWSRGQSWGLYGYTMMYRETQKPVYLHFAKSIANFLATHPQLPKDKIPFWDYTANDNEQIRDASAAAIMASALIELSQYDTEGKQWLRLGRDILKSLSSERYLAHKGANQNFVLKHATGNYRKKSEVDGSLIYADYYFLEALLRDCELREYGKIL